MARFPFLFFFFSIFLTKIDRMQMLATVVYGALTALLVGLVFLQVAGDTQFSVKDREGAMSAHIFGNFRLFF